MTQFSKENLREIIQLTDEIYRISGHLLHEEMWQHQRAALGKQLIILINRLSALARAAESNNSPQGRR